MRDFKLLTLGAFISGEEVEIALSSFSEFYHSVTAKHQKKSKLFIIEEASMISRLIEILKQEQILEATEIIPWKNQEEIEKVYSEASALLLPTFNKVESVFTEALSYGLPILCFEKPNQEDYVDQSCGMMVNHISKQRSIQDFANILQLLYFDPEATKILKKGATNKYDTQFSWGTRQRRATY